MTELKKKKSGFGCYTYHLVI